MPPEPRSYLLFNVWKQALRDDCRKYGNLPAFDAMGDYALKQLWKAGIEPTVHAVVASASETHANLD